MTPWVAFDWSSTIPLSQLLPGSMVLCHLLPNPVHRPPRSLSAHPFTNSLDLHIGIPFHTLDRHHLVRPLTLLDERPFTLRNFDGGSLVCVFSMV